MKISGYTEEQIIAILRQAEGGVPAAALYRAHAMSNTSLYKWRAKYGGIDVVPNLYSALGSGPIDLLEVASAAWFKLAN